MHMTPALLQTLKSILGDAGLLTGADVSARATSLRNPSPMVAAAIARPADTAELSAVMKACHAAGQPVITHGGLSGLVDGVRAEPHQLAVSLERMNRIESIDTVQRVAIAQAGVTLQAFQEAVQAKGLLFPLDLGARGSATLGGNASTNAGGNRVIRYGMMRDMVLGLEAVLADGTVITSLNTLIKNNTGYDLKQLFIGAEGTLGIITRLSLRLREQPRSQQVAFVAIPDFDAVMATLRAVDRGLGGMLSAFEVMWNAHYRLITTPPATNRAPVSVDSPFVALIECMGGDPDVDGARFEAVLGEALEAGHLSDAVMAKSDSEAQAFWALRDDVGQARRHGPGVGFDVSLPNVKMGAYIDEVRASILGRWPDGHFFSYGHLGDGNLHLVACVGSDEPEVRADVSRRVYEPLAALGGSISAEHGIGRQKKAYLSVSRSPAEIALMRLLKRSLDPHGLLNPGLIFDAD
ncbi:MAG: FAD-binding oxidoreductase [Burkholderiaceae bacterium]|nr:FAD-binding oxidoreductase [Burkholderiaceae bacterium]